MLRWQDNVHSAVQRPPAETILPCTARHQEFGAPRTRLSTITVKISKAQPSTHQSPLADHHTAQQTPIPSAQIPTTKTANTDRELHAQRKHERIQTLFSSHDLTLAILPATIRTLSALLGSSSPIQSAYLPNLYIYTCEYEYECECEYKCEYKCGCEYEYKYEYKYECVSV